METRILTHIEVREPWSVAVKGRIVKGGELLGDGVDIGHGGGR